MDFDPQGVDLEPFFQAHEHGDLARRERAPRAEPFPSGVTPSQKETVWAGLHDTNKNIARHTISVFLITPSLNISRLYPYNSEPCRSSSSSISPVSGFTRTARFSTVPSPPFWRISILRSASSSFSRQ